MRPLTSILALALLAAPASAEIINIAFHNGNATVNGFNTRPDGIVVSTGTNGTDTWNNFRANADTLSFTNKPLNLGNGTNSTATLAITSGYSGFNSNGWGTNTDDHVMFEAWYGIKNTESLTIANLPASFTNAGYKVIIYGDPGTPNRTMNYTIGANTVTTISANDFSGTFIEGTNQATITNLSAATFTLTGNPNASDARSAINGIQIVSNDHPQRPTITTFTSDDYYIQQNTTATLSWTTEGNPASITITDQNNNTIHTTTTPNGTLNITPSATTTYTLTATNPAGSSIQSLRIGAGPPRPNIVFFLVDDMGPQDTSVPFCLDANGNPVSYNFNTFYKTPNMEALAADGMRFTAAYAQSVCSPTRTGLMTGRNSTRHAVSNWVGSPSAGNGGSPNNWRSSGLDHTDTTLPQILANGGYRTIHIGKAHFGSNSTGRDPLKLGFDVNIGGANFGHPGSYTGNYGRGGSHAVPHLEAYHNTGTFLTDALTQEANKVIENAHNDGVPFYLNMSYYAVHAPFTTNPDATGNYSGSHNNNHGKYATMLEGMDLSIGSIRQKLIDLGIAENTLIVFIGDNGSDSPAIPAESLPSGNFSDYPLRGKKGSKYEGGTRIPFITCWAKPNPSNPFQQTTPIPANSIETDIVTSYDLPLTFLSAAGLPKPQNFGEDGHDLLPYFRATPGTHRPQEFINHYPHNHRSDFFTSFRSDNWKLIYNYQNNSHELYNLATDPAEQNNLAPTHPETLTRLTRKLAQRLNQTWGSPGPLIPTISTTAPNGNVITIPTNDVDSDNDGISDTTEDANQNGLIDPGETNPDNDNTDGDNLTDGDEAKLGLNPLDPNSHFYLTPTTTPDGTLTLAWPSKPGTTFTIKSSTNLTTWPTTIATDIPASQNDTTTYTLTPNPQNTSFYRIELD